MSDVSGVICDALCGSLRVTDVKIGHAITTSFEWLTGDYLTFYARKKGDMIRLEDDGLTVSELEGAGVDLEGATRLQILAELLVAHGVEYDQNEYLFHTEWVSETQLGARSVQFLGFMLRVQDLIFTARTKVASSFRDDLVLALVERFGSENVERNIAPVLSLSYYVVDITVRHKNGTLAAIFPATSEQKALEAVLFAKEIELKDIPNIVPFLVFGDEPANKIHKQTRSKALNSSLQIGSWEGGHRDVIDKVERYVSQATRQIPA